ncbi:hypothetical protein M0655_23490 (plasmid) [Gordonia amicalis]|jgi:hypothetical protein|uniref:Sigma-70 family RNA polymerase sigma factor n=1 Tax=Gordonia terrae TaxID=2055 RepID=A0A2I1R2E5_9ACTN|nr:MULTISPECIES: hypothetical protein [Gordonia]MDH3026224.1 hypothetical protein [Gordonia alkanivorans]PKZ63295.1 hypothetical protein CYJ73_22460 [Gordonia terrae]UOG23658.1 hypothetical protein MTX80_22820 [Gordonia amicalis]UPW07015.1 hypothetical protein M1C59_12945 [Gordonia terrae]UPW16463.1 hypothetical protein M0655_23490 [Gordonia amicalis]
MTDDDPDAQDREVQDLAAEMREHGRSWADIAHDLALPEVVVKRAADQAHQRAAELAARDQIALF